MRFPLWAAVDQALQMVGCRLALVAETIDEPAGDGWVRVRVANRYFEVRRAANAVRPEID